MKGKMDERQTLTRNRIGNQTLLLMAFLLYADLGLNGEGYGWPAYPLNIVTILTIGLGCYIVRLIRNGAFSGASDMSRQARLLLAWSVTLIIAAIVLVSWLASGSDEALLGSWVQPVLLAGLAGMVLLALGWMIRRRNARDEDE